VLASRLRRGQWEAEVELNPERLATLTGITEPSEHAEPAEHVELAGSVGSTEHAGAVTKAATEKPAELIDAGMEVVADTVGNGELTRVTALAQSPHDAGEHVTLRLDPARTARL